jgi:hypothetical protein
LHRAGKIKESVGFGQRIFNGKWTEADATTGGKD